MLGIPSYGVIRDGDWKLIEWYEDGRCELFNLRDDIGEKTDRAGENPDKVKALQGKLDAWRKAVKAVMPTPNPAQKSKPGPQDNGRQQPNRTHRQES